MATGEGALLVELADDEMGPSSESTLVLAANFGKDVPTLVPPLIEQSEVSGLTRSLALVEVISLGVGEGFEAGDDALV